jgi:hypothetical protein
MTARSTTSLRSICVTLLCTSTLVSGSLAMAQDGPVTTDTPDTPIVPVEPLETQSVQEKLNALALQVAQAVAPLPKGEQQQLQTLVMGSTGKCQWRAKDAKKWTAAKKDQKLSAGTQIRTGRKSKLILRVGLNATLLIDSLARVTLPTVMQNGDTLTTTVQVDRGRTDIKVGHVGLTNDFSVLTPSGALAVKGTEFAVSHSALQGTQIVSARTNTIRAIEVSYFGSKVTQFLSASSVSTQKTPNPAVRAAFASNGPPPLQASAAVDAQDAPSAVGQAVSGADSVQNQTRTLLAAQQETSYNNAEEEIEFPPDYPLALDGWDQYLTFTVPNDDLGHLAAGIYFDLKLEHLPSWIDPYESATRRIPAAFENELQTLTGWHDDSRNQYYNPDTGKLSVPWGAALPDAATSLLGQQYQEMINYGDSVGEDGVQYVPTSSDAQSLLTHINEFCILTFDGQGNSVYNCRLAYANALNDYLYAANGPTQYGHQLQLLEDYGTEGNTVYAGDDCPTCP